VPVPFSRDLVEADFHHSPPLAVGQERPFAGRAAHKDAVDARPHKPPQGAAKSRLVHVFMVIDGRNHRYDHAVKLLIGHGQ
jgi:hypothetical protein